MSEELISSTGEKAVVRASGEALTVKAGDAEFTFQVTWEGPAEGRINTLTGARQFFAHQRGDEVEVWLDGEIHRVRRNTSGARANKSSTAFSGEVSAPMPGMVVRVLVSEGAEVSEGDGVVVLESMKMQLTLTAPREGIIRNLAAVPGTMVEQGAVLVHVEAP